MSVSIFGQPVSLGYKLAPDAAFPNASGDNLKQVGPININSSTFTTVLELSGRWLVSLLRLNGVASDVTDVRLTVDGLVVWDRSYPNTALNVDLIGADIAVPEPVLVENHFKLEVRHATDTQLSSIQYLARPIL